MPPRNLFTQAIRKAKKTRGVLRTLWKRKRQLSRLEALQIDQMAQAEYNYRMAHFVEHPKIVMNTTLKMGTPTSQNARFLLTASQRNKKDTKLIGKGINRITRHGPTTLREATRLIFSSANETKKQKSKKQNSKK